MDLLTSAVFVIGVAVAVVLLALLVATLAVPALRIWPTPGAGTWQSYVFWPLFRLLNVLCLAAALEPTVYFGVPLWVRALALVALLASLSLFVYAFGVLGRDTSYCAADGLVTHGIYQWSRNPQNATLVAFYGSLAVVAENASAWVLCPAMMAVYVLMVLVEEPWLAGMYGEAYRRYCSSVPRFFNWRKLAATIGARA